MRIWLEIEQKVVEIAYFLRVLIEVFWEIKDQNVHSIKENVVDKIIKPSSFYGLYAWPQYLWDYEPYFF